MVATRNHPKDFDPPQLDASSSAANSKASPTKRSTRASSVAASTTSSATAAKATPTSSTSVAKRSTSRAGAWAHTPSTLTLIWLAISLPLVIWDTGYVLLRPHSMPGGKYHAPIWKPYALYSEIDYVYGFPAYNAHNGWTAAQGLVNAVETAAYLVYLALVWVYGQQEPAVPGRGAPDPSKVGVLGESRTLRGRVAAVAVLIGYSTALVTFAKTVLYWLNEYCSGFESIGHNDWNTLVWLWIIPNGAWLIFPAYMVYVFGSEVVEGLETAVAPSSKKHN